jgi:hypothetical protein
MDKALWERFGETVVTALVKLSSQIVDKGPLGIKLRPEGRIVDSLSAFHFQNAQSVLSFHLLENLGGDSVFGEEILADQGDMTCRIPNTSAATAMIPQRVFLSFRSRPSATVLVTV